MIITISQEELPILESFLFKAYFTGHFHITVICADTNKEYSYHTEENSFGSGYLLVTE